MTFFSLSGLIVVIVTQLVQPNYSTINKSQNVTIQFLLLTTVTFIHRSSMVVTFVIPSFIYHNLLSFYGFILFIVSLLILNKLILKGFLEYPTRLTVQSLAPTWALSF